MERPTTNAPRRSRLVLLRTFLLALGLVAAAYLGTKAWLAREDDPDGAAALRRQEAALEMQVTEKKRELAAHEKEWNDDDAFLEKATEREPEKRRANLRLMAINAELRALYRHELETLRAMLAVVKEQVAALEFEKP